MMGMAEPMIAPGMAPIAVMPPPTSWFRVSYLGGIQCRSGPAYDAPLTGTTLAHNETFAVDQEVLSADGRLYLRLADGRGWAFDDTNLLPHDPSVKRGNWMSMQHGGCHMTPQMQQEPLRRRRLYPQPRGKRGGKRCSKRKQAATSAAGA